jgi:hypothetical protein
VVPDSSKGDIAGILKNQTAVLGPVNPLKLKATSSCVTSGTSQQTIKFHVPEDLNYFSHLVSDVSHAFSTVLKLALCFQYACLQAIVEIQGI